MVIFFDVLASPPDIVNNRVSFDNDPSGQVNSDLDLDMALIQHDIAINLFDVQEQTILSGFDKKTPAVVWQQKGFTMTTYAPAYLLQVQGLHQNFHHYIISIFYIPRAVNIITEDCSYRQSYAETSMWTLALKWGEPDLAPRCLW